MRTTGMITTATQWGKTHQVFVRVLFSSLIIAGLVAWYYIAFSRPAVDASVDNTKDAKLAPVSDVMPNNDTRESLVEIESTIDGNAPSTPSTTVKIDGQQVNMSPGTKEHRVIQDSGGTTTIDVSVDNRSTTGKSSNNSTTTIETNSSTEISSSSTSSQTIP